MDLLPYFQGNGAPMGVSYSWASDGHMQWQPGALSGQGFLVKGFAGSPCHHEEFRWDARLIYRGFDTSSEGNTIYQLSDTGLPVSAWCKREMAVGEWFERNPVVTRYSRTDGRVTHRAPHKTWLLVKAHHPRWTSFKGLTISDVIEIQVFDGDTGRATGNPFETYWFARGRSMVGWKGEINGQPAQSGVNFLWPLGQGPGLDREPLPPGLRYEPMPASDAPDGWWWLRPVEAPFVVTSPFGPRVRPEDMGKPPAEQRSEQHNGTDYTSANGRVRAAREGTVVVAGWDESGYGNLVKIDHGDGQVSLYAHLASMTVKVGERVGAGQHIGVIGSTGRSTAPHLHWEVRKDNVPYAPAPYVLSEVPKPPAPQPEPNTPPADDKPKGPGLCSLWLGVDEAQQFAHAMTRLAEIDEERSMLQRRIAALDEERAAEQRRAADLLAQAVERAPAA